MVSGYRMRAMVGGNRAEGYRHANGATPSAIILRIPPCSELISQVPSPCGRGPIIERTS